MTTVVPRNISAFLPVASESLRRFPFFRAMASSASPPKVALLLSGCGVYDGTELTEGASCLIHLSRAGADVTSFAPDKPQMHVVNHSAGQPVEGESRNCLVEAARLARGNVTSLDELSPSNFDALVVPGGFGAAKNLCDFATKGPDMSVDPTVEKVLKDFVEQKKPIGLCCISPVIAARVIPGVRVTVGLGSSSGGASDAIEKMGGTHVDTSPPCNEAVVDEEKMVVTSAAYMYGEGKPHEIDDSVKAMIDGVLTLVTKKDA